MGISDALIRYWFTFDFSDYEMTEIPAGTLLGCGITAFDKEDALILLNSLVFNGKEMPIKTIVENVDITSLDQGHVIPNMNPPIYRGVWFPLGF